MAGKPAATAARPIGPELISTSPVPLRSHCRENHPHAQRARFPVTAHPPQRARLAGAAVLGAAWSARRAGAEDAAPAAPPSGAVVTLGSCGSMSKAEMLKAAGGAYLEETVQGLLIPDKEAGAFAGKVAAITACALPVRCCNGFLPAAPQVGRAAGRP